MSLPVREQLITAANVFLLAGLANVEAAQGAKEMKRFESMVVRSLRCLSCAVKLTNLANVEQAA